MHIVIIALLLVYIIHLKDSPPEVLLSETSEMVLEGYKLTNIAGCKYKYTVKSKYYWTLCTDKRYDVGSKLTITTQDVLKEHIEKVKGY